MNGSPDSSKKAIVFAIAGCNALGAGVGVGVDSGVGVGSWCSSSGTANRMHNAIIQKTTKRAFFIVF